MITHFLDQVLHPKYSTSSFTYISLLNPYPYNSALMKLANKIFMLWMEEAIWMDGAERQVHLCYGMAAFRVFYINDHFLWKNIQLLSLNFWKFWSTWFVFNVNHFLVLKKIKSIDGRMQKGPKWKKITKNLILSAHNHQLEIMQDMCIDTKNFQERLHFHACSSK